MRRPLLFIVVLSASLFALMWGYGAFVAPYAAGGGWGPMSPNIVGGSPWSGYGPGMMGGYGPGIAGQGWRSGGRDLNLSTDNVKRYFERWLAWESNPRLKVGEVKEKDADTIVIDIVTRDNSLADRFAVNRHTSYFQRSED
jgi:hypothetical protein